MRFGISTRSGTTNYVYTQDEFDDAMTYAWPGDTVIVPYFRMFEMKRSALYGVRFEAPNGVTLKCLEVDHQHYENMSLLNINLWWPYGGGYVVLKNSDATGIYTMSYSMCSGCPPVICEGAVSIADCPWIELTVQSEATVDVNGHTKFSGATSLCDDGYTTVDPNGVLRVHSWQYGNTLYGGYDPLIDSWSVMALTGCDWGYIRIEVADPKANVGTIYYGDDNCTEYQTATTVIDNYHYAAIPIFNFPDGDFYWKARIGYCEDKDWAEEITPCKRAKKQPHIEGCPEPMWWPFQGEERGP